MSDFQLVFNGIFQNTRNLLNVEVLNLGITYLQLFLGIAVLSVLLTLIGQIFGLQFRKEASDFIISGFRSGGGNSKNIQVDDKFKDPDYRRAYNELSRRENQKGVNV